MITMLIHMISICAIWLFLWILISGIGLILIRFLGLDINNLEIFLSSFWLGFCIILIILQLWHVFSPIKVMAFITINLIGLVGLLLTINSHKLLFSKFTRIHKAKLTLFIAILFSFFLWLANHAMGEISPGDAGLYHLGMIRWIQSYPIVRGLGNLHGRFAFNNSYFLFLAFLDVLKQPSFYNLSAGLLIYTFIIQAGVYIYKSLHNSSELQIHEVLGIFFLIPIISFCFQETSSTSPDLPIFILGAVIGIRLFKLLFFDNALNEMIFDTFFIVILSATGISIKLSFMIYGFMTSSVSFFRLITFKHSWKYMNRYLKMYIGMLGISLMVLSLWSYRGILLSGYIAYPSSSISLNYEWKVSEENANNEAKWIQSWARETNKKPEDVLGKWEWLIPSIQRTMLRKTAWSTILLPILLFVCGTILFLTRMRFPKPNSFWISLSLIPAITALTFWFFTVPSIRFAGSSIWMLGAGTFVLGVYESKDFRIRKTTTLFASILLGFIFLINLWNEPWIILPGESNGYYPIPQVQTYEYITDSGLILLVPATGDQCWDAPLPCTPYPDPHLRLIEKNNLAGGFMIESP